jgi:hypothetical protein
MYTVYNSIHTLTAQSWTHQSSFAFGGSSKNILLNAKKQMPHNAGVDFLSAIDFGQAENHVQ